MKSIEVVDDPEQESVTPFSDKMKEPPCPVCFGQKFRLIGAINDAHLVDGKLAITHAVPVIVTCSECGGEGTARAANLLDIQDRRK